ncbi:unnamed protein product [Ostreobium quekettii]|uniref:Uncharacterized protein n=1 Tax=Ostreobium quekettii TaxID=121088 RepID=A0A8S1J0N7_9CHLO|nr:unnamed protein product [Ostreobium quekettii]
MGGVCGPQVVGPLWDLLEVLLFFLFWGERQALRPRSAFLENPLARCWSLPGKLRRFAAAWGSGKNGRGQVEILDNTGVSCMQCSARWSFRWRTAMADPPAG